MDRSHDDRRRNRRAEDDRYDRFERFDRNSGPSLHGRYQYGPEEDPHLWDDRWRQHGSFRDRSDASVTGSADRFSWIREDEARRERNEIDDWHHQRYSHDDRDTRYWQDRGEARGARHYEDRYRGRERRDEDRDPSRTWRQFEDWTHTDYGDRRSQGYGYRRHDDYDDRFWGQSERSRRRRY